MESETSFFWGRNNLLWMAFEHTLDVADSELKSFRETRAVKTEYLAYLMDPVLLCEEHSGVGGEEEAGREQTSCDGRTEPKKDAESRVRVLWEWQLS
jgi:hypothetical protein